MNPSKWLFRVRENIKYLSFEDTPNDNYTTSLYVVLRDGVTQIGRYQYACRAKNEHRFEEHLAGVKSEGATKNGLQLMRLLMCHGKKCLALTNWNMKAHFIWRSVLGGANGPKSLAASGF